MSKPEERSLPLHKSSIRVADLVLSEHPLSWGSESAIESMYLLRLPFCPLERVEGEHGVERRDTACPNNVERDLPNKQVFDVPK